MPEPVIRAATAADAAAIVALIAEVAAEDRWILTEIPFDREQRTVRLAAVLAAGRARALVATRGDTVVGECTLFVRGRDATLAICIDRDVRGRGLGRALVAAAIDACAESGIAALTLDVYAHNAGAIALYRSAGFVEDGPRQSGVRRNGDRWEVLTMRLDLAGRPASG